jgi:mycofactocin precursor
MSEYVTVLPDAAEPASISGSISGSLSGEAEPLATEELLVEEVSIDGMCGVY